MSMASNEHSPWEKYTQRYEAKHSPEDDVRLCTTAQTTTAQIIEEFLTHDQHQLEKQVPRRRQILRDFLDEALAPSAGVASPYLKDIEQRSTSADIALIDDRQNHEGCGRFKREKHCDDCIIFSETISIPDLCRRLKEKRRTHSAEKRIIYIPNLTSACALGLTATVAKRSAIPVRDFLHRYLKREHIFSASMTWGFFFEFHLPYHAMRRGPLDCSRDTRWVAGKRLRQSEPLPLYINSTDQEDLYYHEAQTSSLSWGPDEWFWTELFLVDTYFGSEEIHKSYLSNCKKGDGFDPPCGGRITMAIPRFDPREYFLLKLDYRIEQVATEYSALVETFNKRMEDYLRNMRHVFEDDNRRSSMKTLSNIIETTQIFIDCISAIVDAWAMFSRNELSLFTKHASDKRIWPELIVNIKRHISELDRLRRLLLTKREHFQFKLDSLHRVSSLSQTETANSHANTAVSQGGDLKTLTKMTVYVAFPLLFSTAIFSMDFVTPKYPWAIFFAVLVLTSLLNYVLASQKAGLQTMWSDCKKRVREFVRRGKAVSMV